MKTHKKVFSLFLLILLSTSSFAQSSTQVSNVTLTHREGQTFIVFDEIFQLIHSDSITYEALYDSIDANDREITYNIYHASQPITSVTNMSPIGSVESLSGWNLKLYGISTYKKSELAVRYRIEDLGDPLGLSQGLYVYNPSEAGTSYYAVTAVENDVENTTITAGENMVGIENETVGRGVPVLQSEEGPQTFDYVNNATLYLYTRWESSPNSAVMGKPFDYLVGVPSNLANPAPVGIHMHCWGGHLKSGYSWWNDAEDGALLLASNQEPYDWWTGYHENYYDEDNDFSNGVVRPYSTTRLVSFLDWMEDKGPWTIDRSRTFTAGVSMGGSGSIMMAIRYPELVSWTRSWVGVHNPAKSPQYQSSYKLVYGDIDDNVLFEDGTPVWDYYNDIWYLKNHVDQSIGFLSYCNGKNDSGIGWEQAVDFINALQETRQPHLFIWGQDEHFQRTILPKNGNQRHMVIDVRIDQSLPAFTNCSLDDDFGDGDPDDGDSEGQVNEYLYWETDDIVDSVEIWKMTVSLMETAPSDTCLVDITPRRLQNLDIESGQSVSYKNVDVSTGEIVDSGKVVVDEYGLITIEQTTVSKTDNRIIISTDEVSTSVKITSTAPTSATENVEYTYTVNATAPTGSTLTYNLTNAPTGMEINGNVITWTPETGVTTSGEVTLTVSDGNTSDNETFTITVQTENSGSNSINTVYDVLDNTVDPCTKLIGTIDTVSTVSELKTAIINAANTGNYTILIEDGTYQISSTSWYPFFTTDSIVIRSLSGERDNVIIKGGGMRSADSECGFQFLGDNVTIADLTITQVASHGIQLAGDYALLHNIHFVDTYQQMLKGTREGDGADDGVVEYCLFEYSAGIGPNYYIGGIDIHDGSNWEVHDNVFKNIISPSVMVAEHAIHFWNSSFDNVIERNLIINCDRGVGIGLESAISNSGGGIIRNNMIYNNGGGHYADVGIAVEKSPDVKIYNNTIYLATYSNAIEYRFTETTGVEITNNLSNAIIKQRNGASASISTNVTNAESDWFVDYSDGDLRLASSVASVVDQGTDLSSYVTNDIEREIRPAGAGYDIGADEYGSEIQENTAPIISPIPDTTITEGELYTYVVSAVDPEGSILTYSLSNEPSGMVITDSTITWTPGTGITTSGEVLLTVSDGELSAYDTFIVLVDDGTGVNDDDLNNTYVYPNPVKNNLFVVSQYEIDQIKIVSNSGNIIKVLENVNSYEATINMQNISSGVYYINIIIKDNADKVVITKKIIKK